LADFSHLSIHGRHLGCSQTRGEEYAKVQQQMSSRGSVQQQADAVTKTSAYQSDTFNASKDTTLINIGMGYKAIHEKMLNTLNDILSRLNSWMASHPDSTTALVTAFVAGTMSISAIKGKRWIQSFYSLLHGKGGAEAGEAAASAFPKLFGAETKAVPSLLARFGKLLKAPVAFAASQIKRFGGMLLRGLRSLPWGRVGGMLLRAGTGLISRLGALAGGVARIVPVLMSNLGGLAGGLARGVAGLGGLLGGGAAASVAAVAAAGYGGWKLGGILNDKINDWTEKHLGEKSFGAWFYDWVHRNDVDPGPVKQEKTPANQTTLNPPQPAPAKPVPTAPPPPSGSAKKGDSAEGESGSMLAAIRDELVAMHEALASLAQKQVVMTVDGRELGRVVVNVLGREFQKPSVSGAGVDKHRKALPTGTMVHG
jgi:hypothetical protein